MNLSGCCRCTCFDRASALLLNDNGRALLPRALALLDGAAGIELMSRDGSAQAQSLRMGPAPAIGELCCPAAGPFSQRNRAMPVPGAEGRDRKHGGHL